MTLLHFTVQKGSKPATEGGHGNTLHGGSSRKLKAHSLNGKQEAESKLDIEGAFYSQSSPLVTYF